MKNSLLLISLCIVIFGFTTLGDKERRDFKLPKFTSKYNYEPNTIVVKFKSTSTSNKKVTAVNAFKAKIFGLSDFSIAPMFSNHNANENAKNVFGIGGGFNEANYYRVKYKGAQDIETVINNILKNDEVEYAEPSYTYTTFETPNDAAFNTQFYLPQVKALEAWNVRKDASDVIIGIVDTGSEITHPDLASNIYVNKADPIDGIDNDNDGYIDNYYGWDFCGATADNPLGDNNPNVVNSAAEHGVHVSGIASAVTDNGIGVASLARNAKLLIVKTSPDDNPRSIDRGYEGIKYAVDKGAQIINCSWGGEGGGQFGQEIINYAISRGCLVIAAAGNSNNEVPIYPAAFDGVLAVANLTANDIKGGASNYGSYVNISAPGEGIYNTTFAGGYGYKSGTSMAAPLVSSAAALIKAQYPLLNGEQIGKLLMATADNVDAKNPQYVNKLGQGRLNVYRALTENVIALNYQNIKIVGQGFENFAPGTEATVSFDLRNFLHPVNDVNVNISSSSNYVQVLNESVKVGDFTTAQIKANAVTFKIKILEGAPDNHKVTFTFKYTGANAYSFTETYSTVVALDYIKVAYNQLQTTFTSNGRVGYSKASATSGNGFIYNGENMLFESSLLIAKSPTEVMNNARFNTNSSEDFVRETVAVGNLEGLTLFEGASTFTDKGAANPIGLKVFSKMLAFDPLDKFVVVEYEILNLSNTDLAGIYTGLFTDWDLANASENVTMYDESNKIGYAYAKQDPNYPYVGVKLLSLTSNPAYYPLSYQISNSFLSDNSFSIDEKYQTLTNGIQSQGLGHNTVNGYDVMFTLGSGPYNVPKNQSIKVVYAFLAGDDKTDLIANGATAQQKYSSYKTASSLPLATILKQNYPNQAKTYTYIPVDIHEKTLAKLNIYDISGKLVQNVVNKQLDAGSYTFKVDLTKLKTGVYTYQLITSAYKASKKMIVIK